MKDHPNDALASARTDGAFDHAATPLTVTNVDDNASINSSDHVRGKHFHGDPPLPGRPGRQVGKTNGFYTDVSVTNGTTTVKDSRGNVTINGVAIDQNAKNRSRKLRNKDEILTRINMLSLPLYLTLPVTEFSCDRHCYRNDC